MSTDHTVKSGPNTWHEQSESIYIVAFRRRATYDFRRGRIVRPKIFRWESSVNIWLLCSTTKENLSNTV